MAGNLGHKPVVGTGEGIQRLREPWIVRRREEAARTGDTNMSQMHFARKGLVTEEMLYVAEREKVSPELIRAEVAAGRRCNSKD